MVSFKFQLFQNTLRTNKINKLKFDGLDFNDFRKMASDQSLSRHEKVGFPDHYREGKERPIFNDIKSKLQTLLVPKSIVMEIGPGCSELPLMLSDLCIENESSLIYIDSLEMLDHLPSGSHITKFDGTFQEVFPLHLEKYDQRINTIICYSVAQYVFAESNIWKFLDSCLSLLVEGGELLLGDIPNISMRKRFLASASGRRFHQNFTSDDSEPLINFNSIEPDLIDDGVVFGLLLRARLQGFHAWVLPQGADLPMGNRREDILIRRP